MTKKHFIELADTLRPLQEAGELTPAVLEALMRFCKGQNSQFNSTRWLGYLKGTNGPSGGKR